jgi:uncharacterized repeat protein (TIGR01451 family)
MVGRRDSLAPLRLRRAAVLCMVLAGTLAAGTVQAAVGVALTTTNASPVVGGAAFGYTITLTNLDAVNPATDVTMTMPLAPGVLLVNNNPSIAGTGSGAITCTTPPLNSNGTIVCTSASLPASVQVTIAIVAQVSGNLASGARTTTARVQSGATANTASVQQNLQVNAPLSIAMLGPANVAQGTNAVWQISVNNGGNSAALNATISDPLPANTSFLSMFGTGAFASGCTASPANIVSCNSVDIPPGAHSLTIVARVSPTAPLGLLSNTAQITSAGTGSIAVGNATVNSTVTP